MDGLIRWWVMVIQPHHSTEQHTKAKPYCTHSLMFTTRMCRERMAHTHMVQVLVGGHTLLLVGTVDAVGVAIGNDPTPSWDLVQSEYRNLVGWLNTQTNYI